MRGGVRKESAARRQSQDQAGRLKLQNTLGTRTPLAHFPGLMNDHAKCAGKEGHAAACVEQDVMHFLAGTVPSVDGFSYGTGKVPAHPKKDNNPEQP